MTVFIFPIRNSIENTNHYDATRYAWKVIANNQYTSPKDGDVYGVGLQSGISISAYEIAKWNPVILDGNDKQEFESPGHPNPKMVGELVNKSWLIIKNKVRWYWGRGNYIIVKFDGNGNFKILRGAGTDNNISFNCKTGDRVGE